MDEDNLKLRPYDRLKSIYSESNDGVLTERAKSNIDDLLGIKPSVSLWNKFCNFFSKIDSMIFKKSYYTNNFHKRKSKKKFRF